MKPSASFASGLGRASPRGCDSVARSPGDTRRLDEVFLWINDEQNDPWQAVDQRRVVLDLSMLARRDARATERFFKRRLHDLKYRLNCIVTDGLRSYGVTHHDIMPDLKHGQSRYLNNRAENFHQPTRRRERQMQRSKSPDQAQRFPPALGIIYGYFRP